MRLNHSNFHTVHTHSVEKQEILSHQKIFRQINSLVTYLVNALVSRNFCQKCVRVFRNFHSVEKREILSHQKIFRQINCLVKPLLSRNFCQKCVKEISRNFPTVISTLCNRDFFKCFNFFTASFLAIFFFNSWLQRLTF